MDDNTDDEDDDEDHRNHHRKRREGATLCFQYQWLLGHTQVPHYVHIWKKLALEGYPVYRARALLSKIQSMALHFPDFQHNIKVYGVIMGVLMKQEDPQTAPDWAEQIFQYVQDQGTHRCRPDIFLYNQVIQSWAAASERVEAAGKISEWYVRMRQNNSKDACCVRPDIVTFSVLLRFWGRMVDTYQLDCLLRDMKKDHIVPDIICLNGAIYGYATAGKIDKARDLLQQMVPLRPENRSQMRMISEGAQMILLACRDKIKNWNNDDLTINRKTELDQMIKEAEAVFQLVADKVDRPARGKRPITFDIGTVKRT
jgi:pentatricopeptide repeat protein